MKVKNIIKKIMLIIFGSLLLSLASSFFYIPYNIVSGGISGIAIILNKVIVTNISFLNEEFYVLVLEWIFFILGLFALGKKFSLQTLCATIVYPIGVYLFSFIYNNVELFQMEATSINCLIAAIFGGLLTGVGCGLTFLGGGSTGGVDIPNLIIYKYFKVKVSYGSFVIDSLIIILGIFVIQKFDVALIGIIAAFITALAIEKVFIGGKSTFMAYIVSPKYEEINEYIISKMERGATLLYAEGGYSRNDVKVIQVCFDFKEYYILKSAILAIDKNAFITICKAHEVKGYGFDHEEKFSVSTLDKMIHKHQGEENE